MDGDVIGHVHGHVCKRGMDLCTALYIEMWTCAQTSAQTCVHVFGDVYSIFNDELAILVHLRNPCIIQVKCRNMHIDMDIDMCVDITAGI